MAGLSSAKIHQGEKGSCSDSYMYYVVNIVVYISNLLITKNLQKL